MQTFYWVEQSLDADLVLHKGDRSAAKEAIAKAAAIRGKDAAAFAKTKADLDTNIAALAKAIPAIEKGMGGLLQTSADQISLMQDVKKSSKRDGQHIRQGGFLQTSADQISLMQDVKKSLKRDGQHMSALMESAKGMLKHGATPDVVSADLNSLMQDVKKSCVPFVLSEQAVLSDALLRKTYTFWKMRITLFMS